MTVHQQSGPPDLHQGENVVTIDHRSERGGCPEREGPQVGHPRDPVEVQDPAVPEGGGPHLRTRPVGGVEVGHVESPPAVGPFRGPTAQWLRRPFGDDAGLVTDLQAVPQAVDQGVQRRSLVLGHQG